MIDQRNAANRLKRCKGPAESAVGGAVACDLALQAKLRVLDIVQRKRGIPRAAAKRDAASNVIRVRNDCVRRHVELAPESESNG